MELIGYTTMADHKHQGVTLVSSMGAREASKQIKKVSKKKTNKKKKNTN